MSNLVNPLQSIIDQAAMVKPKTKTVEKYAERINPKNTTGHTLLFLDISASMAEVVGQSRKIDLLRQALDRTLAPGEIAIAFHSIINVLPTLQLIPEPQGGTAMHLAIEHGCTLRPKHSLVVSDGLPDDEKQALSAAKRMTGTISTLYIGPDSNQKAIEFMRKLARLGCGQAQACDLNKGVGLLRESIKLLLPSGGNVEP